MNRYILVLAALAIGANVFADDDAQDCACQRCGCQAHCHKVCRVVCEMKEVKKTCYSCQCEDFCVPGPSCKVGEVCECNPCGCNPCGCKFLTCIFGDGCTSHRTIWKPSCEATVRTRNKLYKREVTVKVPTYKWVVEYTCDQCQAAVPCQANASAAPTPPPGSSAAASSEASAISLPPPAELNMASAARDIRTPAVQPAAAWAP